LTAKIYAVLTGVLYRFLGIVKRSVLVYKKNSILSL
jgi:hypothetical protein